jgi:hypothetical protein
MNRFSRKDFPNPKDKTGIPMKSKNVESATEKGKKEREKENGVRHIVMM